MEQEQIKCRYCGQSDTIVKAGLNHTGSQRMLCKECRRYFTPNPKPMGHDPSLKTQAIQLCLEGMSFRAIGRVLGVNFQSVINWLNAYHDKQLPLQVEDTAPTENVEIDELFTFVGKKSGKHTS